MDEVEETSKVKEENTIRGSKNLKKLRKSKEPK